MMYGLTGQGRPVMIMGGRGAASGVSAKGIQYGKEYHSILVVDNIKFIEKNEGSAVAPLETMSADKGRIYVLVDYKGELKSISMYDKNGKVCRQIDIDHFHLGHKPHVHIGYAENRSQGYEPMTRSDISLFRKVMKIWKANGLRK
jgi:hypothetical protein